MIAAILKAQFLSMRLRSGVRRGATVFSALTALLFYVKWTPSVGQKNGRP